VTAGGEGAGAALHSPAPLCPGDLISVVAPASGFNALLGWRGLGFLAERYRVRFDRNMFEKRGYLAGSDDRRRDELARALSDPSVRAIVCARGGYGVSRIVADLPWEAFAKHPKWIVGFSDITALHVEATRLGVGSVHAPHLNSLGQSDARGRNAWLDALEMPERPRSYVLQAIASGEARGPLVGGNLTVLHACAAAGRLALPRGCVLFLEDIGERPYRIDRVLTTLVQGSHLRGVAGVVLGDFTECFPGPDGVTIEAVLRERLGSAGIPVASGLPAGHGDRNDPLVLGRIAELRVTADRGTLTLR